MKKLELGAILFLYANYQRWIRHVIMWSFCGEPSDRKWGAFRSIVNVTSDDKLVTTGYWWQPVIGDNRPETISEFVNTKVVLRGDLWMYHRARKYTRGQLTLSWDGRASFFVLFDNQLLSIKTVIFKIQLNESINGYTLIHRGSFQNLIG